MSKNDWKLICVLYGRLHGFFNSLLDGKPKCAGITSFNWIITESFLVFHPASPLLIPQFQRILYGFCWILRKLAQAILYKLRSNICWDHVRNVSRIHLNNIKYKIVFSISHLFPTRWCESSKRGGMHLTFCSNFVRCRATVGWVKIYGKKIQKILFTILNRDCLQILWEGFSS